MAVYEGINGRKAMEGPTTATSIGTRTICKKNKKRNQFRGEISGVKRNLQFLKRSWQMK
jgi:hypothetical protein